MFPPEPLDQGQLMAPIAVIIDTETTDIDNPEVIELAWVSHDGQTRFHERFLPKSPSKWGALATHHILWEDLVNCLPSVQAAAMAPTTVRYWIGHNIDFDWSALGKPNVRRICTLACARRLWPELDSHSLSALAYFLLGATASTREMLRSAHSAGADVEITRRVWNEMQAAIGTTDLDKLWAFSEDARIPRIWTFGKFKGQPIEAADRGYANWCRKQPNFDPYVLEALRRAGL